MRGLFTLLIATIAALVGGVIGFQLGITSNIGAAGGTVVWHAGFPFFGWFLFPLFFFLFIGLLAFAFGGRRRGWGGGPGREGAGALGREQPQERGQGQRLCEGAAVGFVHFDASGVQTKTTGPRTRAARSRDRRGAQSFFFSNFSGVVHR